MFPCAHKFHADCLYQAITPYLLPSKRGMIDDLQKALQDVNSLNFSVQPKQPTSIASNIVWSVADVLNQKLFTKIKSGPNVVTVNQTAANIYSPQEIENLKSQLDDILAEACIYCGDNLIKTIDEPFFNIKEYDEIFKSWL